MRSPKCSYCKKTAVLAESAEVYGGRDFGKIWLCRPCKAWVGIHKNSKTFAPLGRLANAELRLAKQEAHKVFDGWQMRTNTPRKAAYQTMAHKMNLPFVKAHIGMFDVDECKMVVKIFAEPMLKGIN